MVVGVHATIGWIGHATTLITDRGTSVLTDPILTSRVIHLRRRRGRVPDDRRVVEPDVVVLSHLHADHTHLPSLRRLGDVPIVAPRGAPDALPGLRSLGGPLTEVTVGDEVAVGGVTIRAVHAEHDGRRWPRGPHTTDALGYVIAGDSTTYFAGDTDLYPGLGDEVSDVDTALLPVAGWGPSLGEGHLNPERAVAAAIAVGAVRSIPIHFGTLWPIGLSAVRSSMFHDPGAEFVRRATAAGLSAIELRPGESTEGRP